MVKSESLVALAHFYWCDPYESKATRVSEDPVLIDFPANPAGVGVCCRCVDVPREQWKSARTTEPGFDAEYVASVGERRR